MKNVIRTFIATAVISALAVSSFAQGAGPAGGKGAGQGAGKGQGKGPGGPGGPGGQRRGPGMFMNMDAEVLAKIKLSDKEKAEVKKVKDATAKKAEELRKSITPGGDRSAMREKFKGLMEGYRDGIKKALTAPHYAEYEKGVKEMMQKIREKGGFGGRPGGPGGPGGPGAAGAGKGKGKGGN